ncbi:MAG: proprotein convertase P-domain-containing protein, partial [Phycisphaerales bacterium]|nr:proprotein convertase P-domain-containing protein [Phycisphaerales bacterium]
PEVVYGSDDRKDVYQVSDPQLLQLAQAACVVVFVSELTDNGNGTYTLDATPWLSQGGTICADEPFRGQLQVGFCSGFLVGDDLVTTAGHCVDAGDIGNVAFVFGFDQRSASLAPEVVVPASHVYFAAGIVNQQLAGGFDHSLVRLDRDVTGFQPVPIRRSGEPTLADPLVMIGHPVVLPKKIDDGGEVKDARVGQPWFYANVDAYGGNSGSMVVNLITGEVEGILVRGNTDFTSASGCVRSAVCADSGCPDWEEISKISALISDIPPLGMQVTPGGAQDHIGLVGGPFTNDPVPYLLTNSAQTPVNYAVILSGGTAPILINGSTNTITGTLPGQSSTLITMSLDPSAASLPAGVYTQSVFFDDQTNGRTETRVHRLEIGQTGITVTPETGLVAGGPVGGPFNATMAYTITSTRPTSVMVEIDSFQPWISVNGSTAPVSINLNGTGQSAVVTIGFSSDANALPNGLYSGSVNFTNITGGAGTTSRDVSLDVGRYTYQSPDTPQPINDGSTITSTIMVTDSFCVGDVDVEVDITHTYIGDLILDLRSPEGTVVRLHNRTGGTTDNLMTTYDDASFPPDGPGVLADYAGEVSLGLWTLTISDNANIDTGSLNFWKLKVASSGTSCPPSAFDDFFSVPADVSSTIELTGSSGDPPLSFIVSSLPAHGTLSEIGGDPITSVPHTIAANGDMVRYDPVNGYQGADSFAFHVRDSQDSNTATISLDVGGRVVVHDFPLDSNPGWQTTGDWAFGQPTGAGTQNFDPTSGFTGSNVYGYNLLGDYPNNLAPQTLTTTALDMTGVTGAELHFARWLAIESARWDHAMVEVSNNGFAWTLVWDWTTETSVSPTSWDQVSYDISAVADNQPTVYIRWTMGATDSSVTYPGWNIDDIQIKGFVAADACPADVTGASDPNDPTYGVPDGAVDAADFFYYLDQFVAQNFAEADLTGSSDPNDPTYGVPDGAIDAADFFYYLDLFVEGCS